MKKAVFMSKTPYHILLATSLAKEMNNNKYDIDLVVRDDFQQIDKLTGSLKNWEHNPFKNIIKISGIFSVDNPEKSFLNLFRKDSTINVRKKNVKFLKKRYKNEDIERVHVFNDRNPESQYMLYLCNKKDGVGIYIEDGLSPYVRKKPDMEPFYLKMFYKVYYGFWYENITQHGEYEYVGKGMVHETDLIKGKLKNKTIRKMRIENFIKLKEKGLIDLILERLDLELSESKIKNILILPHSDFLFENNLFQMYKKLILSMKERNKNIAIKYHPREKNYYLKDVIELEKVFPQPAPIEIIFLYLMDNPPTNVIGDTSTALMTSKFLLKETNIISLIKLLDYKDDSIENLFDKMGVLMPKSIDELRQVLY